MTLSHQDQKSVAKRHPSRFVLPVFVLCVCGTGLLWLLEPPVVDVPAEIEEQGAPVLEIELAFPEEQEAVETEASATSSADPSQAVRVAGLISPTQQDAFGTSDSNPPPAEQLGTVYWAFPDGSQAPVLHPPRVVKLPSPNSAEAGEQQTAESTEDELQLVLPESDEALSESESLSKGEIESVEIGKVEPFAILMPPVEVPGEEELADSQTDLDLPETHYAEQDTADRGFIAPTTPTPKDLTDLERQLIEQVVRETHQGATGELTNTRINEIATKKIHQANALARRGAPYAARQKLIEVLRMVSQSKDNGSQQAQYSAALAAGLRALEEAQDFLPRGAQLEAELDVDLVVGAHRTPLASHLNLEEMMPQQMLDRYLRYAQLKMAMAVAGDPAGSMALYALGKVTSQMGQVDKPSDHIAHRQAVAFQQAALLAHSQNHYAAHELAVLLADSGHYRAAHQLLLQVADRKPNPMVYRNLARVEMRLGLNNQAQASSDRANKLSASTGSQLINWVPPEEFAPNTRPVQPRPQQGLARQPSSNQRR